jgi:AcrR family transcriptional regulator
MANTRQEFFKMLKLGRKDPKQSRSKDTVDAIFGAVTHILGKEGAVGLTTNKIAEVAGVSVGSLYQYFKNKESIFEGILLKFTEDNLKSFEKILSEMDPEGVKIRDIITLIVKSHFDTIIKMEKVTSVLFQYAPQVIPHTHFKKSDERIINFLMQKIEEHKIPIAPAHKEQAFFVCSQAVRSVLFMTFLNRKAEEREIIMNELIEMLSGYLEPKT